MSRSPFDVPLPRPAPTTSVIRTGYGRVHVECRSVSVDHTSRFEVRLRLGSHTAIVDVPGTCASSLEERVRDAAAAFEHSVRLRPGPGSA